MKQKTKVLFILKKRHDYNSEHHSNIGLSTGLYNSASFMNDSFNETNANNEQATSIYSSPSKCNSNRFYFDF